jgi:hypothetical protein
MQQGEEKVKFKQLQCKSGKGKRGRGNGGAITCFGIGWEDVGVLVVNEGGHGALALEHRWW